MILFLVSIAAAVAVGGYLTVLVLARGKAGWLCVEQRTMVHHRYSVDHRHWLIDPEDAHQPDVQLAPPPARLSYDTPPSALTVAARPIRQLPVPPRR